MGVEDIQERLGDLGKIVVDLAVYPGAEKGKSLDEPFGMWVFALIGFEEEPPGNLGVLFREFNPHFTNKSKLPLIIAEKVVVHESVHLGMK
jgi:hypothetical protein